MPSFFATAPKGVEEVLAGELRALGAQGVAPGRGGVAFSGEVAVGYRACLWLRTASRVLMPLASFPAPSGDALYEGAKGIRWEEHLSPTGTLAVDSVSVGSAVSHTLFASQRLKDAVVDRMRDRSGKRPSVDLANPDLRINVYLNRDVASVSLDLSGESLHRRGWRSEALAAPMKESLAAAVLLLARWPEVASRGGGLVDPMCGSGTFLVEAAWMAAEVAPGLGRRFGFERWLGHDAAGWARIVAEAKERDGRGRRALPPMVGYDLDAAAVRAAATNLERAGLKGQVHVERRELSGCNPVGTVPGIFVANPPYGERMGELADLRILYRRIGDTLKQRFPGWDGYIFTGNLEMAKAIGLHVARRHVLYNGPIESRLLHIPIMPARPTTAPMAGAAEEKLATLAAPDFANRLAKNLKHLSKWAKREGVTCFRVYDSDLPEYALAVDLYERSVHVQEYSRPETVDPASAERRLHDALAAIPSVLGVSSREVHLKVRRRQRAGAQYEVLGEKEEFREVGEGGLRFLVNFTDHLDTGLFLDHRPLRALIRSLAKGRRFLNLFGYTGTASVYAAAGGASSTTTVDLSNTYLEWARRNLSMNGFTGRAQELVRDDCLRWMVSQRRRWGLILLDPPTFSRSKAMDGTLDVQRDHVELLKTAAGLLEPDGVLLFSTNFRRFKLDAASLAGLAVEDLSPSTIPPDFARNPRVHRVWRITRV